MSAPEPPSKRALDHAIQSLVSMNAFDSQHDITRLGMSCENHHTPSAVDIVSGYYLSVLSLEPIWGKLVLVGLALRCLDPILTIASVSGNKDPFIMPMRPDLQVIIVFNCRKTSLT